VARCLLVHTDPSNGGGLVVHTHSTEYTITGIWNAALLSPVTKNTKSFLFNFLIVSPPQFAYQCPRRRKHPRSVLLERGRLVWHSCPTSAESDCSPKSVHRGDKLSKLDVVENMKPEEPANERGKAKGW
jgi:hypothetical protein